jgi:two-component sensor histidine kinase
VGRINSMSALYDKLLIKKDYQESSVKIYAEGLIESVTNLFYDEKRLEIETRIEDFVLPSKTLFPLGIIINEILTNTMKYAFADTTGGSIDIFLTRKENHVTLTIQDNGCGLPEDFALEEATGFGLTLVRMLSDQLAGSYSIENREKPGGTRNTLEFDV